MTTNDLMAIAAQTQAREPAARLGVVSLIREQCYAALSAAATRGDTANWDRTAITAGLALDVPIETMAAWVDMDLTVMANLRLMFGRVQGNLETARAQALVSGAVAVTYDGVTWAREES